MKTYAGSCHCKAVRFEVDVEDLEKVSRCNCTFCTKRGQLGAIVKPGAFRLVAGESETSDLRKFAKLVKQRSGWRFARRDKGRLWQPGYYDRVLRDEDATAAVVKYIIANPVRAEIVESPLDYPHWGSALYTREQLLDFVQDASPWRPERRT